MKIEASQSFASRFCVSSVIMLRLLLSCTLTSLIFSRRTWIFKCSLRHIDSRNTILSWHGKNLNMDVNYLIKLLFLYLEISNNFSDTNKHAKLRISSSMGGFQLKTLHTMSKYLCVRVVPLSFCFKTQLFLSFKRQLYYQSRALGQTKKIKREKV